MDDFDDLCFDDICCLADYQYFDDDVSYANYVESTSCSLIGRGHATQVTYALGTLVVCKYTIINIRS